MSSIFLSHSHEDKPFARRLAADLRSNWHHVWLDEAEIAVGDSLLTKIADAIDRTDYVAAVISANSVNSSWVRLELEIAMTRELSEGRVVVLPIVLTTAPLPPFLRGKLYADFTRPGDYYKSVSLLLDSVEVPLRPEAAPSTSVSGRPRKRFEWHQDALVSVFRQLYILVAAREAEASLGADTPTDRTGWPKAMYEGHISAALCLIAFANTAFFPTVAAANARVHAIAFLMARHALEMWPSARPEPDTDLSVFSRSLTDENAFGEEYRPTGSVREALYTHCPPRQGERFYYGWDDFASLLLQNSFPPAEDEDGIGTNDYLMLAVTEILADIGDYEARADRDSFVFWAAVTLAILNLLLDDEAFTIVDDAVEQEAFVADLEAALEITAQTKEEWRTKARRVGVGPAARAAVLELRSLYEFVGTANESGLTVEVLRR